MPRHIIITLHGVMKLPIPIPSGGDNLIQRSFHVPMNVRVRIISNCQTRRGTLDAKVALTYADRGYLILEQ